MEQHTIDLPKVNVCIPQGTVTPTTSVFHGRGGACWLAARSPISRHIRGDKRTAFHRHSAGQTVAHIIMELALEQKKEKSN